MRYAIVGSRDYIDLDFVKQYVSRIPVRDEKTGLVNIIVSGGAMGVDSVAENTARLAGLGILIFKPDWIKHGRAAGPIRNQKIVDNCDRLAAFWDGKSKGTKNSIELAEKAGVPVEVYVTTE
jgi:hypothetical protein